MSRTARLRLLIVGVGGQGVLTAARALGEAALGAGLDVAVGQLHGMAQRGGSVEASVVMGNTTASAFVEQADVVLGFEPLEVLRALPRIVDTTHVVLNIGRVVPFPLAMQGLAYPDMAGILSQVRDVTDRVTEVDGPALLSQLPGSRALNMVMLGVVAGLPGLLPFEGEALRRSLTARGSSGNPRTRNFAAFDLGRRHGTGARTPGATEHGTPAPAAKEPTGKEPTR